MIYRNSWCVVSLRWINVIFCRLYWAVMHDSDSGLSPFFAAIGIGIRDLIVAISKFLLESESEIWKILELQSESESRHSRNRASLLLSSHFVLTRSLEPNQVIRIQNAIHLPAKDIWSQTNICQVTGKFLVQWSCMIQPTVCGKNYQLFQLHSHTIDCGIRSQLRNTRRKSGFRWGILICNTCNWVLMADNLCQWGNKQIISLDSGEGILYATVVTKFSWLKLYHVYVNEGISK